LELTGFGNGQQASRGQLAGSTAIPEADFSPLHTGAQGPFGTVVGGLDTFLFQKREQPLIMLEQSPSEIPDLAMGTI
jgi:hypothetical protein